VARAGEIEAGVRFSVKGSVTGEVVSGVGQWFELDGGRFVWAGGCRDFSRPTQAQDGERPNRDQLGDYTPPVFEIASGVRHAAQGRRPGGLEGLIVHFDAYRIKAAGNGSEDSDRRTLDMMRAGQANGYHYGEISRTGKIFLPEGFDWGEWGSHAGVSKCPVTGRTGVSRYYVGFEMNNPGLLHEAQEDGVFCPWFNAVRDATGAVVLDGRGRCTRKSASDEWHPASAVRKVAARDNMHPGAYLPYSFDQFEALTHLCLYLARTFPATFSMDRVFGHDEVAPTRKNDPGGALADPARLMTMPEFRAYLTAFT
jgi:N-acetyl-anhydromuramyl-L-alanine amidase AmpD